MNREAWRCRRANGTASSCGALAALAGTCAPRFSTSNTACRRGLTPWKRRQARRGEPNAQYQRHGCGRCGPLGAEVRPEPDLQRLGRGLGLAGAGGREGPRHGGAELGPPADGAEPHGAGAALVAQGRPAGRAGGGLQLGRLLRRTRRRALAAPRGPAGRRRRCGAAGRLSRVSDALRGLKAAKVWSRCVSPKVRVLGGLMAGLGPLPASKQGLEAPL